MKQTLQIANILLFVIVILVNYFSNTGLINNTTIGEVSKSVHTLFTPATYAFSIWGLIYLLLFGFVIYQSRSLFTTVKDDTFIETTGWWFVLSCIANSVWVLFWLYGYFAFSILAIFVLLFSLLKIVLLNRMELWDASLPVIFFLWWPFVVYSGWVTVASIANVSAYLSSIGWNGWGISETTWTLIMIIIAGIINVLVILKRNMREFTLVGSWALTAIAVANWDSNQTVTFTAIFTAAFLLSCAAIHAIKNRSTSPFTKIMQHYKR
ncbi:tryptophan-rich sensory protein [Ulvibacter antarcticus]|uniref:TspO/MBR related protein n=1 Tax=Ulvibacter antarcticus TaxID=442714 RepID=A0A3L9Z233_9FLAO|nr:tryptophan-rich sensory protein [Ulvibacter antarcticus]RMA66180.1 hypothetical protein BXY75_0599 [Ulvibacter antarcticus]